MIFFDLDDTLMDDRTAMTAATRVLYSFNPEGYPSFEDFLPAWVALCETSFQRHLDGELDFHQQRRVRIQRLWPAFDDRAADERFAAYLEVYEAAWAPFADVVACLDALAPRRLGIITNGQREQQLRKLDRMGLRGRFDPIVVSSDVGAGKPDPKIFLEACRRGGVTPADSWMIGDRLNRDPIPSAAAGLRGVWLNRDPAVPADPRTTTIRSLAELPALVRDDGVP